MTLAIIADILTHCAHLENIKVLIAEMKVREKIMAANDGLSPQGAQIGQQSQAALTADNRCRGRPRRTGARCWMQDAGQSISRKSARMVVLVARTTMRPKEERP